MMMECSCLAAPVSIFLRRRRYERLSDDFSEEEEEGGGQLVTVVAGKEKMKFLVDRVVLELNPFRILMEKQQHQQQQQQQQQQRRGVIFMDVDGILIEHILWLIKNDSSSLSKLNFTDIVDFYAHDD